MSAGMPQGASDIFEKLLPLGVQAYPDRVREIAGVVIFEIDGDGGGTWTLDATSSPPVVKSGPVETQNSLVIKTDHESFKKMMVSPDEGIDLYLKGKIQVSGDANIATRMRVLFDITRRNPGPEVI